MPVSMFSSRRRSTAAASAMRRADYQGGVGQLRRLSLCASRLAHFAKCTPSHCERASLRQPGASITLFSAPTSKALAAARDEPAASSPHARSHTTALVLRNPLARPAPPPQFLPACRRLHDTRAASLVRISAAWHPAGATGSLQRPRSVCRSALPRQRMRPPASFCLPRCAAAPSRDPTHRFSLCHTPTGAPASAVNRTDRVAWLPSG